MELLSHDIKMAGYGMTGPVLNCPTAIVPADNTVGGPDTGPDSISLVIPTVVSPLASASDGSLRGEHDPPSSRLRYRVFCEFSYLNWRGYLSDSGGASVRE